MATIGKLKLAFGIAVAALVSTSAQATVFDFGFLGNGAIVSAEINASLVSGSTDIYQIDSYTSRSSISSFYTMPSIAGINATPSSYGSVAGSVYNVFRYDSATDYSIRNGFGFTTSAGSFDIKQGGSFYNLESSVPGASTSGIFTLFKATPAVLGTPGPVAGAGLLPLLGLAGLWVGRRRKSLSAV